MKRFSDLFKIKRLKIDLVGTVFHFKNKILQKRFNADLGPNYFFSPQPRCSCSTVGTTSLGFIKCGQRDPPLPGELFTELAMACFPSPPRSFPGGSRSYFETLHLIPH